MLLWLCVPVYAVVARHVGLNAMAPVQSRCSMTPVASLRGGADAAPPMASVEMYTTPGCSYCRKAKSLFKRLKVQFDEIDVSDSEETRDEMIRRSGAATLPQIFVAGEHVGGATELLQEHEVGALATRFEAANIAFTDASAELAAMEPAGAPPAAAAPPLEVRGMSGGVLNAPIMGSSDAQLLSDLGDTAAAISTALQKRMLLLMDGHISEDGSRVDYAALRTSAEFAEFCDAVGALDSLPADALDPSTPLDERKAFWINLYNCLVLHATAVLGVPADATQRSAFFSGSSGGAYQLCGGLRFTLDDIEHGVLRCNSPTVGSERPLFGADDSRLAFSLTGPVDPRVHFALNCGAKSCPPIKFYAAERLDSSLALSSRAFLEADLACDVGRAELTCTKLLDWYGADFGASARARVERLRTLLPADVSLHAALGELLEAADEPALVFRPYDWGSNEA